MRLRLRLRPAERGLAVLLVALLAAVVGCGGATAKPAGRHRAPAVTVAHRATQRCAVDVAAALGQIGANMYEQAATGRNVKSSRKRLARSAALADAVAANDARATRRALRPLIKHQITRIVITGGAGRRLAAYGTTKALAPVHGTIRRGGRTVGRYVMSVSGARALAGVMATITGADVVMKDGRRLVARTATAAPHGAEAASFTGHAFPRGVLRTRMLFPSSLLTSCGTTREETKTQTVGAVGRRLLGAEATGAAVHRVLHVVGTDPGMARAVEHHDAQAVRRAVIRMFRDRNLHVVRIAARDSAGRLINDVGGPYALSAASGPVTLPGGRRVGTVTLSIQDDTGYIKLMHRFTGADVQLRLDTGLVPGSNPAPRRPYGTYRIETKAFDGAPLHVALLVPRA